MREEGIREEKNRYCSLFLIYGNLLTKTVRRRRNYFFLDDYSLSEIAQLEKVSRNAVFLSLSQGKEEIDKREKSLGFAKKRKQRKERRKQREKTESLEERKKGLQERKEELDYGI